MQTWEVIITVRTSDLAREAQALEQAARVLPRPRTEHDVRVRRIEDEGGGPDV